MLALKHRYSVSRLLGYYDCQKEYDCCADIFKEASRLTIQVQECRGWRSLRMELHAVDSTFFEGEIAFLVSIFR
ncbi:hypothetical protein MUK42_33788 [Musa troglodytarum]|uniref:Uncharacterized protein n=1 Tax=Musa troglodytarum TaxID=320322 RepID=A0A9E7KPB2_9LILI|nr:hypothetical protein MUK42_33788 [Musa troglodytarum]